MAKQETQIFQKCRVTREDETSQKYSIVVPDRCYVFIQYKKSEQRGTEDDHPIQSESLTMKFEGQKVAMEISRRENGISLYEPTIAPEIKYLSPRYRFENLDPEARAYIMDQLSLEARILLEEGIKRHKFCVGDKS